jgi:hypothetical protein
MTAFKKPISSALSKILLTGLVATALFSTPAQAHENHAWNRRAEQSVASSIPRTKGDRWFAAPAVHAHAPAPSDQPGGVCDLGDDPMIC